MEVVRTDIEGVLLIKPKAFGDHRGFFLETFQAQRYAQAGIDLPFVQDNLSRSRQGILRGLHFQRSHPQGKLVSVTRGRVFDVAVDIRPDSLTFGKWYGAVLDDENHHQLWVAPGLAHGFCVMSETADFTYKCTDYYHPEDEGCLRWNDPDIGIDWPVDNPTLSDKDAKAPSLRELFPQRFK
ncbi:dTDP-4-dehydrorhamnose 3,5-epimerase [Desulfocurvibacter africanus PCS]|uniref:dTDP-4-dehydrorhamnose 3,5-epimerase n=1 Tax=Desulfocurvibacter africanus PCS TaxID=1262666 RepID=M5PQY5_DESAF|nr:dTDP-4-dehydrorhamnose 3,5-epimerase [Desulfocurvibacter africanus]EMG36460.1 dTDP-4-dehydrorhamnose 3,5-epimerase [Desulfocurvibacter africanus PCS]